jgi:transcriptional regulator with XRE-family HTH domain
VTETHETPGQAAAANVQKRRKQLELSQGAIASRMSQLGCSWTASTASRVESGERPVSVDEFVALGLVLDIKPLELLLPTGDGVTFSGELDPVFAPIGARLFELWLNGMLPLRFDPQRGVMVAAGAESVDPDLFVRAVRDQIGLTDSITVEHEKEDG